VPARDGEIVIVSAVRPNGDGDQLVAWVRRIEDLKKGRYVSEIGRFSQPPRIEDLAALTLDNDDLEDIRRCRSGACGVKLSDEEIAHLRQTAAAAGTSWKLVIQEAFRGVVLARVQTSRTDFLAYRRTMTSRTLSRSLPNSQPSSRSQGFSSRASPDLPDYLTQYPRRASAGVESFFESFFSWSKEALGGNRSLP
jgi:hypothetical protein